MPVGEPVTPANKSIAPAEKKVVQLSVVDLSGTDTEAEVTVPARTGSKAAKSEAASNASSASSANADSSAGKPDKVKKTTGSAKKATAGASSSK